MAQQFPGDIFALLLWWVVFVGTLGVIYIIYKIVIFSFKRFVARFRLYPSVTNGIRFVMRLVTLLVAFGTFSTMSGYLIPGGIPIEVAIIISTAIGTVFALSATTVVQNFVAGIYIILTRPFNVGDLVSINDYLGIVDEISLNHTKLRLRSGGHYYISNQAIINSKIVSYTLPIYEHEEFIKPPKRFKDELINREITRFAFSVEVPKSEPERLKRVFQEVTDEFGAVFCQPIRFITTAYLSNVIVSVILVSEDPEVVLKQRDNVVQSLYARIYK